MLEPKGWRAVDGDNLSRDDVVDPSKRLQPEL